MTIFRTIAGMLLVAVLAAASAERAEAAVLLPDLATVVEGDAASDTSMAVATTATYEPESDPAIPNPFAPIASTTPSPAVPTTGSVPVTTAAGGVSALPASPIGVVGSDLVTAVQCEHRCGWTQLYRAGVFRPPRSVA